MAREIPLTKGKVAIVDDADFDWLSQWKWMCSNGGRAVRGPRGEERYPKRHRLIMMHRQLLQAPDGLEVDHIDGDPLNNQRSNLRLCTHQQNMKNRSGYRSDKLKGAFFNRSIGRWQAVIVCDGRRHYLGTFGAELDAALAYDKAARELHGAFARLNFPDEAA
ncbi:AP2/ERF family transcription factor [Phenylobacterium deserti]|uniref:Endonuclease n=1 Tax=Phenylobacterium deserti TaxID=1914756 RepID=A0A328AC93_9CAUL|nr:AP2/ERF family transcription factor [Phenylobacterium deserti]RAK52107.1 endonuclease [Phenylobacterium deserti]